MSSSSTTTPRRTGYLFEERYMWHDPGSLGSSSVWIEPAEAWENVHTKRRIHNLLTVTEMVGKLTPLRARRASREEICRFHTEGEFR